MSSETVQTSGRVLDPEMTAKAPSEERAADIVDALNEKSPAVAAQIVSCLPPDRAVEILDQPGVEYGPEIVAALPLDLASELLAHVSADSVADLFRHMEEPYRGALLKRLDRESQASISRLLAYPADTAGSIMTTEFVSVPANYTVSDTLNHIRHVERTRETVYAIYVLDPATKKLEQVVTLRRLIAGDPTRRCSPLPFHDARSRLARSQTGKKSPD